MLLLAGAVFLIRHFVQLEQFIALARRAQPAWLIAALVLQFSTYVSVVSGWNAVLGRAGHAQSLRRLIPIAVSKLFADQAVPGAGMGGNVLLIDRLTALGTPRAPAMAALLVSMIGFYAAYAALAVVMLLTLWSHRQATPLLTGVVTTFLLVALAIPSLALWLRHRGSQPLSPRLEGIGPLRRLLAAISEAPDALVKDRHLIGRVAVFNAMIFLADAATLAACLRAVGDPFEPSIAFVALMSGSIAMTLTPIPLGLGSFEASCIAMLTLLGVKLEPAVAATLLLRGLTLWLPLFLGLILIRRQRKPSP
ncbi:flippase-like domain-containing protein [Novosphingobium sp. KCTC 2891]|uniref:lysylphosphatidylglycerol synthase transmembrane domain-containing protein n=1 Tax=Novosphingobium sp. KCTC 2891 TaxID=2989730 RepID=UPI002222A5D4|nr:lysylphosphatidylglycerol synthase transmembrane domain-containing protein [Novosphingobium sp. KCTC 2891]MCW1381879.1 flippase-like domain-containing protein [Novosphingobium sp. KCTC 2891]